MDQIQQKALNALEPFVLLSKSATSPRAAADLVKQATSSPNTFVFAELLQTPNVQALTTASPEYSGYFTLLQIFAWGTWADYQSQQATLPPITELQQTKLRQLTLLTLASTPQNLTYPHLLTTLSLPSPLALESLVISSIYAGLLVGQLNPLHQRLDIISVAPLRDLRPGSVPLMVNVLEDWDKRCVGVLDELQEQVAAVRKTASERRRREEGMERQRAKLMDEGRGAGGNAKRGVEGEGGGGTGEVGSGLKRTRGAKGGAGVGGLIGGLGKRLGGGG